MKRLAASVLAVCMLVACSDTVTQPPAADDLLATAADSHAKGVVEMVTGSGHYETQPPALNPGIWRTFTMNAKKKGDGSVTGYAQHVYHPDEGEEEVFRGTISCFTIIGNRVWIGGHVEGNEPSDFVFQVVDNGVGDGDPDRVGLWIQAATFGYEAGFAEQFCDETPEELDFGPVGVLPVEVVLFPIVEGNIQVKVK